jgi:hypothetical protein
MSMVRLFGLHTRRIENGFFSVTNTLKVRWVTVFSSPPHRHPHPHPILNIVSDGLLWLDRSFMLNQV